MPRTVSKVNCGSWSKGILGFWLPPLLGIGLSLVFKVCRGWGINFLALDKPTYQILASYEDQKPQKSNCVVGGWVVGGIWILVFSLRPKPS